MPESASNGNEAGPRESGLITVGEWADIMTRLYRIIIKELTQIETRQNARGEKVEDDPKSKRYGAGTKRLVDAARSVEVTFRVNKGAEGLSKKEKEALERVEDARESLRKKLDEVFGPAEADAAVETVDE